MRCDVGSVAQGNRNNRNNRNGCPTTPTRIAPALATVVTVGTVVPATCVMHLRCYGWRGGGTSTVPNRNKRLCCLPRHQASATVPNRNNRTRNRYNQPLLSGSRRAQ